MSRVLLVAPCGEIQETNSSKKKGFREEALFSIRESGVCKVFLMVIIFVVK